MKSPLLYVLFDSPHSGGRCLRGESFINVGNAKVRQDPPVVKCCKWSKIQHTYLDVCCLLSVRDFFEKILGW